VISLSNCVRDSSVKCPFIRCIAGSIEFCNIKSGRFTPRGSKVDLKAEFYRRVKR
jgi:hypothetical protein